MLADIYQNILLVFTLSLFKRIYNVLKYFHCLIKAAKVAGYLMNADYVEQDLVLTKDDVPIVLHDIYIGINFNF